MAKPISDNQMDFFDAQTLCSNMLDPEDDAVIITLRDHVAPLVTDEDYADMYKQRGRRPVSPKILILSTILQYLENLPDRQTARNVRLRLDWKMVLDQPVDYSGFHFTLLEKFRDRLQENEKEQAAFDTLLDKLTSLGLIKQRGRQRLDSTHLIGLLRQLSRLECLTESLRLAFRAIEKEFGNDLYEAVVLPKIRELYGDRIDTRKMDKEETRRTYKQAGKDTSLLFARIKEHHQSQQLMALEEVQLLRKIFKQNFEVVDSNVHPKKKQPKGSGKEKIVNPHEPDARYSKKRSTSWLGHKLQVTETVNTKDEEEPDKGAVNFLTDIESRNAAEADAEFTQEAIDRQEDQGLNPEELYVDEAYVSGTHIAEARKKGTELMGPAPSANKRGHETPVDCFDIDFENEVATCPEGVQSVYWHEDQKGCTQIGFDKDVCAVCERRYKCTSGKGGRRLTLVPNYRELQQRRRQMQDQAFREKLKVRSGIEGTISELVRGHGLRRARYRGRSRVRLQALFAGLAVNIKRFAKAIVLGLCPDLVPAG